MSLMKRTQATIAQRYSLPLKTSLAETEKNKKLGRMSFRLMSLNFTTHSQKNLILFFNYSYSLNLQLANWQKSAPRPSEKWPKIISLFISLP